MDRRNFAISMALSTFAANFAMAADALVEGGNYVVLPKEAPVSTPGKIEVLEFFAYWCPHCYAFQANLEPWIKTLPADVVFRRVPVSFQDAQLPYQKLFYALETIGAPSDVHNKVFKAFHDKKLRVDSEADLAPFAAAIGVDKVKFMDAFKSFSVTTKARAATAASIPFDIEGVPTLAVQGKYVTSPEKAKGQAQVLNVVDALIKKVRSKK